MLAAWLRMKYPSWFQGALAASAPILQFEGYVDLDAFYNIATLDYKKADYQCPYTIKDAFSQLTVDSSDPSTYQSLKEIFNLCDTP